MSVQSKATEGAEPSSNISFEELIAQRSQQHSEPETETTEDEDASWGDEPEVEVTEESEDPEQSEVEVDEVEEEEQEEEIDVLSLTPEQIQELAKKGKSRLLQRIGELTAQKRNLEEKLSAQAETKPLPVIPTEQNPFRELDTLELVQAKHAELEKVVEETDNILEEYEDYGKEDIIVLGDQEFTKKEIRLANKNAREALAKYLPSQHAEIARRGQRVQMEEHFNNLTPKEVPEVTNEESALGREYKALLADPLIEQVRKHVPDLGAQLPYILAHALRSIHRSKRGAEVVKAAGEKAKTKVSGSPFGAGAAKANTKTSKKNADQAYQRFNSTHTVDDWIAARVARMQKI